MKLTLQKCGQDFDYAYRVASGLNFINLDWIIAHNPKTYDEKVFYFIKLRGYIELLKTVYFNNKLKKHGRFDPFTGEMSDLSKKLLEIIFGITAEIVDELPDTLEPGKLYLKPISGKDNFFDAYEDKDGTPEKTGIYHILSADEEIPTTGNSDIKVLKPIDGSDNNFQVYIWDEDTQSYVEDKDNIITINNSLIKYLLVDDNEILLTETGEKIIL